MSTVSNPLAPQLDISPGRRGFGRRQSDALNESLSRLLNQMPDGVLCCDRDWRITFANPAAVGLLHLTPEQMSTMNHWEIFPEKIGTEMDRIYRRVMETGECAHFESFCDLRDVWLDSHVIPTAEGITIYFRDITDRKGAELLRDSASRQLLQVLEATSDAVVSINREGKFTFLNRRARELLAIKGDLVGKNIWHEFPFVRGHGQYLNYYTRAMNDGLPGEFEDFYPEPLNLWLSVQMRPSDEGMVIFFRDITARRQYDIALRQQQELLAVVQETALVATWDVDLATGKISVGDGSYPVFGHPHSELPDLQAFTKFLLPEYFPVLGDFIRRTSETGEMIVADFPIRAADGSILWVENRAQALMVDGVPTRLRGLSIDITDRKRNEEALATSEERYRILTDLNPQCIWMAAPDGHLTYANQILLDYLGFTEEDLQEDTWLKAFHPDDRERVRMASSHSVATGTDYDLEARMIRARDGRARWWWIRAQPLRDEQGKILHWIGVNIDIDDRKTFADTLQQRQEETERQRAELETIYRTSPVGLALFDPVEFRYLRVNDRQTETLGLPREEILGRRVTELAPLEGIEDLFRQVAAGGTVRNHLLEGELPTRPGEYRYWNLNYSPIQGSDGHVEAIAAVIQEITHQKKAEQALVQSEKLAAVGRLASSISHEINNPLEAITNLLYLIATSDELPTSLADYVQTAQSELSRVCQIATQTLRFHRQAVSATHVAAQDLVEAVLNLYQGRLANSGIRVETSFSSSSHILCFENDIRQVLNNLIANALDAMRQTGGRLLVRAHDATDHACDGAGVRRGIRITIADTGHGMSPDVRARIFEPFYTTKELNGTGLGLWISHGIVTRHQGRISLRSTQHPVHHGTIFSLFLPCVENAEL
ncbi:PAS domain-containing protein [Edaphobacter aggregans]|uniref:PAS domain-containing protein n=1 Tax=Edaphobacter aggregans TaxID=570835 RepID=UPI00068DD434|nr:PAS domain-containing protein [Edaphobacter aggregans]